jgi:hypothetical protein
MSIFWPPESDRVTIIDGIRNAIGREITINVKISGIPCPDPTDALDPITNLSVNQFCTTCFGEYWLEDILPITVTGVVSWKGADTPVWSPGGFVFDGDCLIQMKYTASGLANVDAAESFVVDNKVMIKKDVILRGVPQINRILVTLLQKEK